MKTIDDVVAKVRTVLFLELYQYEKQVADAGTAPDRLKELFEMIPHPSTPNHFDAIADELRMLQNMRAAR